MVEHFLEEFRPPSRAGKPRDRGLTVVMPQVRISETVLERYAEYIDVVKLLDATLWAPADVVGEELERYRAHDVQIQMGGLPYELARQEGREEAFLARAKELGIDWIEYETHVSKPTAAEISDGVGRLKDEGFSVVGEVGAKWYHEDDTRRSLDRIHVDRTVEAFERFLDAGCDKMYWEGLVVRNLIGKGLDNRDGQKALLEVTDRVGVDDIVFEIWGPGITTLEYAQFWSWLVYRFGPDVNVGNVPAGRVPRLESIRKGTTFDMNHPYVRWLREGEPTDDWWRMPPPPYDVGLERD